MVDERPVEAAFQMLGEVVRERYSTGKRTVTAALKPPLVRRTLGGFDEVALGFRTFRDFIKAAEDRGVVRLLPATDSSDLEVLPAGVDSPIGSSARDDRKSDSPGFVRPDLWRAFLDWTPGLVRVYDKRDGSAHVLDVAPQSNGDADVIGLRRRLTDADPDLVPIEPIGADEQQRWMREFIESVEDPHVKIVLNFALHSSKPLQAFARATRADAQIQSRWNAMRARRVIEHISQWMRTRGIEPSGIAEPPTPQASRTRRGAVALERPAAITAVGREEDAMRREILDVLGRMPLSDLLRLPIPAEYMLGR